MRAWVGGRSNFARTEHLVGAVRARRPKRQRVSTTSFPWRRGLLVFRFRFGGLRLPVVRLFCPKTFFCVVSFLTPEAEIEIHATKSRRAFRETRFLP